MSTRSPRPFEIVTKILRCFPFALETTPWTEIEGDTPEAAALARGWTIEARDECGVVASEPNATWAVGRLNGKVVAALAVQRVGMPSITRLNTGMDAHGTVLLIEPPAGWRVVTPGMFHLPINGMNVMLHVEELDDEVMVATCSARARRPSKEEVALFAAAFCGPGAEIVSYTPQLVKSHLKFARFVAYRAPAAAAPPSWAIQQALQERP